MRGSGGGACPMSLLSGPDMSTGIKQMRLLTDEDAALSLAGLSVDVRPTLAVIQKLL